ncbi:hypothetical protein KOSB73_220024 [Klebsiella grimontii]|uniref:Uncharacterized protein n=1 Tax=Klebsiella grimontii TaxID=2058152 RepID=A0A285AZ10_9ENTR|nr:hypothetical protein KOSB73_220024 [Klebsiella grimontii]
MLQHKSATNMIYFSYGYINEQGECNHEINTYCAWFAYCQQRLRCAAAHCSSGRHRRCAGKHPSGDKTGAGE